MEYRLSVPIPQRDAATLRSGDVIYLTGTVYTARDAANRCPFQGARASIMPALALPLPAK